MQLVSRLGILCTSASLRSQRQPLPVALVIGKLQAFLFKSSNFARVGLM